MRLREARKSKHLTQEQAGGVLGMTPAAVGQWEREETTPELLNLIYAAELYEASLDWLITRPPVGS